MPTLSTKFFKPLLIFVIIILFSEISNFSVLAQGDEPLLRNNLQTYQIDEIRFEDKNCQEIFPPDWWNNVDQETQKRFRCGYLVTWENYDSPPKERIINLAVMIAQRTNTASLPKPEPIIYLDGGPGDTGFPFRPLVAADLADHFDRDLIQFGQRGSYFSDPRLDCPDYRQVVLNNWVKHLSLEKWNELQIEALEKCLTSLSDKNTFEDITNFNSKFNALDVINLIHSLGYEKANLYGLSYGTLLAQHVLALSPQSVRSVVLDGVVPLGVDPNAHYYSRNMPHSLNEIFDACAIDPECKEAYPDLRDMFSKILDQLKNQPAPISVRDENRTYQIYLDNYGFIETLGTLLYSSETIKAIPRIIYAADNGKFEEIGTYYFYTVRREDFAWGMYYAVYCTEFASFNPDNTDLSQVESQLHDLAKASEQFINRVCPSYGKQNNVYGDAQITDKNIPVLIFNGQFDPITPPEYGERVASEFSTHYEFNSPISAHGSSLSFSESDKSYHMNECAKSIMKNFFDHPDQPPDKESCWTKLPQDVEFDLPMSQRFLDWWRNTWVYTTYQKFINWVDQVRQRIDQAIKDWEEFQRNIQDPNWWAQKMSEWLLQCCGSLLIPGGIILLARPLRRKRIQ